MALEIQHVLYAVLEHDNPNKTERIRIMEVEEDLSAEKLEEVFDRFAWSELKNTYDYLVVEKQYHRI